MSEQNSKTDHIDGIEQDWLRPLLEKVAKEDILRRKIILIGENDGIINLNREDSRLLASMLRSYYDPDDINV